MLHLNILTLFYSQLMVLNKTSTTVYSVCEYDMFLLFQIK